MLVLAWLSWLAYCEQMLRTMVHFRVMMPGLQGAGLSVLELATVQVYH
jgi:hypothetical protein